MLFYIIIIFTVILLAIMTLRNPNVEHQSKKYQLVFLSLLLLIVLVRIIRYGLAMGLNVDEAMGGYNSWCLANYGVDSHLMKMPVYLIAWGSGMNVLYPAISIPIIKLFGLSVLSYRFPMVFLSILSVFTLYNALMNNIDHPKFNLFFIAILYLNPWMIMANRWSLESNLFPLVMIFALSAFLTFLRKTITGWLIVFDICIGLSAYAYSDNWIFLALFVPLIFGILLKTKKINLKKFLMSLFILFIIVWPLLLFVYVNYFGHRTLHVLGLTVPLLLSNRGSSQMIFGNGTPLIPAMIQNFLGNINAIANGDGLICNSLPGIGLMFPGMFIVALIGLGLAISTKKKSDLNRFMLISVLSSIPVLLFVVPNANHMNALILPIFYFEVLGLMSLLNTKMVRKFAISIFVVMMLWFVYGYFGQNAQALSNNQIVMSLNLKNLFDKLEKSNKKIYFIDNQNGGMYAVIRFFEPENPKNYARDSQGNPQSYGKWHFYSNTDQSMRNVDNAYFVVLNNDSSINLNNLPSNAKKVEKFDTYDIYEN